MDQFIFSNFNISKDGQLVRKSKGLILFLAILVIAFFLRVFKISEHSLWHEEFVIVGNIRICDLLTNIKLLLVNVPEYGISPGGLILYYYWIHLVDDCVWLWRLLPILVSLLSICVIYFFGNNIGNKKVGLLSALFVSLSPFNTYISQELKNYSFVLLLSLLSWFSFYKIVTSECWRDKKKWFAINCFSNILLPWFHSIYIHVFFLQLIPVAFLIVLRWRRDRKVIVGSLWIIFSVLLIGIYFIWVWLVFLPFFNLTLTELERVDLKFLIVSIFGNDCLSISNELLPPWKTYNSYFQPGSWMKFLSDHWIYIDYLTITVTIAAVLVFLWRVLFILYECVFIGEDLFSKERTTYLWLAYMFLSPIFFFLALRIFMGEGLFLPLYFFYESVLLFLIVSFVLVKERKKDVINHTIIIFLTVLMFIQGMMFVSFPSRPDYKKAVAYLEENVEREGIVLDFQMGANVFETWKFYKKRRDYTFKPVFSIQAIVDETQRIFANNAKLDSVWVLMETSLLSWVFNIDPTSILTEVLNKLGLEYTLRCFPGSFNLYTVNIRRGKTSTFDSHLEVPPFSKIDYEELLNQFNSVSPSEVLKDTERLRYYFSVFPPLYSYVPILILGTMLDNKDVSLAKAYTKYLIKQDPHNQYFLFLNELLWKGEDHQDFSRFQNTIFGYLYPFLFEKKSLQNTTADMSYRHYKYVFVRLEEDGWHILNKVFLNFIVLESFVSS